MNARFVKAALLAGLVAATPAWADAPDAWITTKAKIALLTADKVSVSDVNVDTVNGTVTLHGKVKSEGEKVRAVAAVRGIDGVKDIRDLLQVVPEAFRESAKVTDAAVKDRVEVAIKADPSLDGVKVASVNNGVVLLSGHTPELAKKLRAIETAWKVSGVQRVATEITTGEK